MAPQSWVGSALCPDYGSEGVAEALSRLLKPWGGWSAFVSPGERVLLKVNLLSQAAPERAVTTHPSVVEAVARGVMAVGGIPEIGDSPPFGGFRAIARESGIEEVARKLGIPLLELGNPKPFEGGVPPFQRLLLSQELRRFDKVINLAKVKTHTKMVLSLAVKNLFGVVPGKLKGEWHLKTHRDDLLFAMVLVGIYRMVNPAFSLLDGIVSMEGEGPSNGTPRNTGFLAGSPDGIALDAYVASLLGLPAKRLPTLQAAEGMGLVDPGGYELLGERPGPERFQGFLLPKTLSGERRVPLWFARLYLGLRERRPWIDAALCERCGRCRQICPAQAIVGDGEFRVDLERCIRCFCCQEICPAGAVLLKKGWKSRGNKSGGRA